MNEWWREAVAYQIYPRSFADSNGDGIGDLKGITSKLNYLKKLGIDVIWLSPFYKSPDADSGYDISDYRKISEKFGTMKDFDRLLKKMHKLGIRLIIDGVFNHTSDEHRWFLESRKSKTNRFRNYYFWRKGKNGREPNNWASRFGGSAWEYDSHTGEYFMHIWSKKQADLNWNNTEVRDEIHKVMKWWLDRGVDGFRFDVINFISKIPSLPDSKSNGQAYADGSKYYINGPKVNSYLKEMNRKVVSKYNIMTVGETSATLGDIKIIRQYVDSARRELNMVTHENSKIRGTHKIHGATDLERKYNQLRWNLADLKKNFTAWQKGLYKDGWDTVYLANHDFPRIVSRFGDDGRYRVESAKMLATLLLTLRGTPFIYQGEEIGMTNMKFGSIKDYDDIWAKNMYSEFVRNGGSEARALRLLQHVSRDNARTPMQWDGSANAGFTRGTPWIKINDNYKKINVANALRNKKSIFYYYKKLIDIRKRYKILIYGNYDNVLQKHKDVYSYTRTLNREMVLVILNFRGKKVSLVLPKSISKLKYRLLIGNYGGHKLSGGMELQPYEALVYRLR